MKRRQKMNVRESREAFLAAVKSIADTALEAGFITEYKCYAADRDLSPVDEDNVSGAAIIAAELSLGAEGVDEKVLLECAISVMDGECSADEMAEEIALLRNNVKELTDKIAEGANAADTISELFRNQRENEEAPQIKTYNNKSFYITAGIAAAVIVLLLLIINSLH